MSSKLDTSAGGVPHIEPRAGRRTKPGAVTRAMIVVVRAHGEVTSLMAEFGRAAVAWIVLFVAGLLEIVWAYTMKLSEGFTRPGASVVTLVAMIASFGLLSMAMRTLPLGTAYTVWTGIGAVGAFVLGVAVLGEPAHVTRILAAVLIVAGIVLMKMSSG